MRGLRHGCRSSNHGLASLQAGYWNCLSFILSNGYWTLIDSEDFEFVAQWKWFARTCGGRTGIPGKRYGTRKVCKDGKSKDVLLHRALITPPSGLVVDHGSGDSLDNRRRNLRISDDLESPDALENPEYRESALQIACRRKDPKILKRLKPDPATDDLRELMAAAASLITTPETIAYLVSLGADVNDKPDGGSTVWRRA